ncbi:MULTISPECIES: hypothetical protein [Ensifer]|jgi:hypothetical protein|uniref:Uncharacterized protein n=1 Tax=Ensifer canadensis TaxID=555315 RepID=A0AAW4FG99_9HYPH|nr:MULTISPECIES: hypothetical protein [Ensifer]MDP9631131.1 hypothetical protein [Ensifer adhaerens]KQU82095.1 hypothetical protein ASD00_08625 [Ensifer sp. Root31]KQY78736.1 hypothetical protein ASD52_02545 [Ensifer sp. Root142]MBD9487154.1 hypothetical protein [Ensifer sp. ENS11]MBM3091139.1 hypothetical protein [Ensifer canadensis]
MTKIAVPLVSHGHPDREPDCESAVEGAFLELVDRAEAAGWTSDEIADCLVNLSHKHRTTLNEDLHILEEMASSQLLSRKRH